MCWTVVYDTIYALQDIKDDKKIGVKSTAITFGESYKPILTAATTGFVATMGLSGYMAGVHEVYYCGIAAAGTHLLWQVWTADEHVEGNCLARFQSNDMVGWAILASSLAGGYLGS